MLQDPENFEEISIEVKASSESEAIARAEVEIKKSSDSKTIVTCIGCKRKTKTTGKFICTIRIEAKG